MTRHHLTERDIEWLKARHITVPERLAGEVGQRWPGRSNEYESGWRDRDLLAANAQKTFIADVEHWQQDSKFWRKTTFVLGVFAFYLLIFLAVTGG